MAAASVISGLVVIAGLLTQHDAPPEIVLEPLEPVEATAPAPSAPPDTTAAPQPTQTVTRFAPGSVVRVAATSLALRSEPDPSAALIYYIPQYDSVTVLSDPRPAVVETIGDKTGSWTRVSHNRREGYVFDAYLEPLPTPIEDLLDWTCVPGVRVGPIDRNTTYQSLVDALGAEHLSETTINLGEELSEPGTRVFADSDRELIIRWSVYQQTPLSVTVLGPKWRTTEGIAVGTRASSLAALNGTPFSFYGFGWEFGGEITNWNGGALEQTHTLREKMRFTLSPQRPFLQTDLDQLTGSSEFSSGHRAVSLTNLYVSSMTVLINPTPASGHHAR